MRTLEIDIVLPAAPEHRVPRRSRTGEPAAYPCRSTALWSDNPVHPVILSKEEHRQDNGIQKKRTG